MCPEITCHPVDMCLAARRRHNNGIPENNLPGARALNGFAEVMHDALDTAQPLHSSLNTLRSSLNTPPTMNSSVATLTTHESPKRASQTSLPTTTPSSPAQDAKKPKTPKTTAPAGHPGMQAPIEIPRWRFWAVFLSVRRLHVVSPLLIRPLVCCS